MIEFEYQCKEDGSLKLTAIPKPEPVIEIPPAIDGHQITEIGTDFIPFGVKSIVREIILPDTVKVIDTKAFHDLRYLKKLVLPESLETIRDFGIFTCPDLTELYIPASVTNFGNYAFGYMYEHGRAYKMHYFTLLCRENSGAMKFAAENKIDFEVRSFAGSVKNCAI